MKLLTHAWYKIMLFAFPWLEVGISKTLLSKMNISKVRKLSYMKMRPKLFVLNMNSVSKQLD